MSSTDLPRLRASCVSYRASQIRLQERLVLVILCILCIHVHKKLLLPRRRPVAADIECRKGGHHRSRPAIIHGFRHVQTEIAHYRHQRSHRKGHPGPPGEILRGLRAGSHAALFRAGLPGRYRRLAAGVAASSTSWRPSNASSIWRPRSASIPPGSQCFESTSREPATSMRLPGCRG